MNDTSSVRPFGSLVLVSWRYVSLHSSSARGPHPVSIPFSLSLRGPVDRVSDGMG